MEETDINQITTKTNIQLHHDSAVMGRSMVLWRGSPEGAGLEDTWTEV